MTTDDWLRIAQIVSTLMAPSIAGYILSRINRPTLTPDTNQQKTVSQRIGRWLIKYRWPITLFVVSFSLAIYNLTNVWHDQTLPLRSYVMLVAIHVAALAFLTATVFFLFLFSFALRRIRDVLTDILALNGKLVEQTTDWMNLMGKAIEALPIPDSSKNKSSFDRIVDNLKKLIP